MWTIVNGASILFCANVLGIIGLVFGILGITRASTDVSAARRNVRLSWIFFLITVVLAIIGLIIFFSAVASGAFDSSSTDNF